MASSHVVFRAGSTGIVFKDLKKTFDVPWINKRPEGDPNRQMALAPAAFINRCLDRPA